MQGDGIRRGVGRLVERIDEAVAQRADHRTALAQASIAWAIHCETEVLPLVPVTPASQSFPKAGHRPGGRSRRTAPPAPHLDNRRVASADFSALLCNHRRGAPATAWANEIAAIDLGAGEGDEDIARLHAARIGGQARSRPRPLP
jgi:hypothetical protein